jgi:hypothetical protein
MFNKRGGEMNYNIMLIYGVCLLVAFAFQARIFQGVLVRLREAQIALPQSKTVLGYFRKDRELNPKSKSGNVFFGLMALEVVSLLLFAVLLVRSTLVLR